MVPGGKASSSISQLSIRACFRRLERQERSYSEWYTCHYRASRWLQSIQSLTARGWRVVAGKLGRRRWAASWCSAVQYTTAGVWWHTVPQCTSRIDQIRVIWSRYTNWRIRRASHRQMSSRDANKWSLSMTFALLDKPPFRHS